VNSLLRRYREVVFVGVFLALPFVVYFSRDQTRWLDRGLMAFSAPVEHAIVVAVGAASDAWGNYVWLLRTRADDFELRREMLRQRAELQTAAEITAENARLRGLLELADKSAPMKLLAAPVVAVGASPHSHTLRIGRGTSDGIKPGDAVIAPDGIVGTILLSTANYSDVQLIVAPQAAVPALSARTRGRSTVRGTGDLSRCHLDYALRTDELADGDLLVTAGGAGFFPKGLKIGRVVDVQKRATGMFIGADVIPAVSFSRLDEVLVVLQAPDDVAPVPVDPAALPPSAAPEGQAPPAPARPSLNPNLPPERPARAGSDTGVSP
jgi:rod shape-determining protein MreC